MAKFSTVHDADDHSGVSGYSDLLDETAHDALDHTGLTGVGGAGGTSELSRVVYDPVSEAVYTTSSSSFADVDATNLTLPDFEAPASGEVEVHVDMLCRIAGTNGVLQFNVRDGSGDISGSDVYVGWNVTNIDTLIRYHTVMRVTGLTPSATISGWKLGFARGGGSATTMGPRMGGANGPGIVTVRSVA